MGEFYFFVIYVYNDVGKRFILRDFLVIIVRGVINFWFVVGDFNVVFNNDDRLSKICLSLFDIK